MRTISQEDYCKDCIHGQNCGCNVMLKDDEECEDKEVLTCENCKGHQFEVAPELYDEGYSLVCLECGNVFGER